MLQRHAGRDSRLKCFSHASEAFPTVNSDSYISMSLAERVKTLRLKHGKTQFEVAEALGMKQASYWKIETGETPLTLAHLASLAVFYKEKLDALAEGYEVRPEERMLARALKLRTPAANDTATIG